MPNVFEFLDAEQSSINLLPSTNTLSSPPPPSDRGSEAASDDTQKDGLNTSFHSDSGISMPESSSEREEKVEERTLNSQLKTKALERQVSVKRRARPLYHRVRPRLDESRGDVDTLEDPPYPEAYYRRGRQVQDMIPPSAPQPPSSLKPENEEASDDSGNESGYEFVASKISKSDVPPVYRRFAKLNHRILLHFQDEIAEMEEELQYLDDAESQCRVLEARATGRPIAPASRRVMPRSQRHNAIFFRRLDLLGRLSIKVEQYNQLLASFNRIDKTLPTAAERDITTYRSFLDSHVPIPSVETKFLDHDGDLVSISRTSFGLTDSSTAYFLIAITATALVLPLLAFSAIPQFLGRVIVLGLIGAVVTLFVGSSRVAGLLTLEEVWRCGAMYVLPSSVLWDLGMLTLTQLFRYHDASSNVCFLICIIRILEFRTWRAFGYDTTGLG
jgi:hypothetical protein